MEQYIMWYDINIDKWCSYQRILELSHELPYDLGCVLTKYEKYLIILYYYRAGISTKIKSKIEIMDIENDAVRCTDHKLPNIEGDKMPQVHAFLMDGYEEYADILINGYLRKFSNNEIPYELIGLIAEFYAEEVIHLIDKKAGLHWRLSLDDILQR